jgi:hypothetical protein
MLRRLFGSRASAGQLEPAGVRAVVAEFLLAWLPFSSRYTYPGPMSVNAAKDESSGRPIWRVGMTPAIDMSCGLVVSDDDGIVVDARLAAMRGGAVLAQWHR